MDALIANLQQIIRWPKPSEFEEFASEFEKVGRFFPNVIGAIDGLHLEIELTEERRFEPSFINYKQFHSLDLQVSSVPYQKNQYLVLVNFHSTYTGYWFKYFSGLVTKNVLLVNCPSTYIISHLQGVKILRKKCPYKSLLFSGFL